VTAIRSFTGNSQMPITIYSRPTSPDQVSTFIPVRRLSGANGDSDILALSPSPLVPEQSAVDRETRGFARHAIIIGGGASGVLLAYQLLRDPASDFRVTLIEKRPYLGRGLAYHTGNPDHLLNVRAANMSALPDQPDHFWRWISTRGSDGKFCPDPYCFVPRRVYGDYIASLIEPFLSGGAVGLTIIHGECVQVSESGSDVTITLADGTRLVSDVAVLAIGHDTAKLSAPCYADPWAPPAAADLNGEATVLIFGTGLTMIDYVLTLLREGHRGSIIAMSRRGLLSKAHRRVEALRIDEAEVPFGAPISQLLCWFRHRVDLHVETGGDWRGVVDALRPFTRRLWRELSLASKRRFLEHVRPWWDIHRHRMAPEVERRIADAVASGKLTLLAAKMVNIEANPGGALVRYRRRGRSEIVSLQVDRIVDCTGIVKDPRTTSNPLMRNLFDQALARVDPLQIGIEIGPDCAVVAGRGEPSRRLFAIGPLTRAAFWEIIAIPDIRNQCAELAAHLVGAFQIQLDSRSAIG
jgi:uncharacterized NAD(P)/FAD-binding protein YdhS